MARIRSADEISRRPEGPLRGPPETRAGESPAAPSGLPESRGPARRRCAAYRLAGRGSARRRCAAYRLAGRGPARRRCAAYRLAGRGSARRRCAAHRLAAVSRLSGLGPLCRGWRGGRGRRWRRRPRARRRGCRTRAGARLLTRGTARTHPWRRRRARGLRGDGRPGSGRRSARRRGSLHLPRPGPRINARRAGLLRTGLRDRRGSPGGAGTYRSGWPASDHDRAARLLYHHDPPTLLASVGGRAMCRYALRGCRSGARGTLVGTRRGRRNDFLLRFALYQGRPRPRLFFRVRSLSGGLGRCRGLFVAHSQ